MNRTLVATLIAAALVALNAVSMALVDGTIALPPAYAWVAAAVAAIVAALKGFYPSNPTE